jgi:cytochrome P450
MADSEPDFFHDLGIINSPKGYFDRMRSLCPVHREPHQGTYMVTGYDAVMEVLNRKDDVFSAAVSVVGPIPPLPFAPEGDDISEQLEQHRPEMPWSAHLNCFDGARHTEYRNLLSRLLTYKRLKANEDYLYGLVDRLIDGFIGKGRCDAAEDFAHATATYAVSDLMGIPEADRPELLALLGAPPSQVDGDVLHKIGPDPLIFLKPTIDGYLHDRQAKPQSDLMSELANATLKDGFKPNFDVLSGLARFLFGAGQDTTSRLIAMAVKVLAEDQELQQHLRENPTRVGDFIEEVLRFDAPVKAIYRLARRNTKIGGIDVPAGSIMTVCLTAASNDPGHFVNPQQFDIDRPNNRDHLAFSKGAHACLGAPLGRLESRVAIERLLARTRQFDLSEEQHGPPGNRRFRFEPTFSFRSLSDLHIVFKPA